MKIYRGFIIVSLVLIIAGIAGVIIKLDDMHRDLITVSGVQYDR